MEAVIDPRRGRDTPAARLRIDLKWVILGVCVAVVAYLAVIPLGFLLLTLQGLSEIIKRAAALTGRIRLDADYERPPP